VESICNNTVYTLCGLVADTGKLYHAFLNHKQLFYNHFPKYLILSPKFLLVEFEKKTKIFGKLITKKIMKVEKPFSSRIYGEFKSVLRILIASLDRSVL